MIQLYHVSKDYQQLNALDDLNFQIEQGEIVGIIGKSGSGKSTLLRILNLIETPTKGEIYFGEKEIQTLTKKQIQQTKQTIGMIFQHYNLLSNLTVHQNVALPLKLLGKINHEKVDELLDFVGMRVKSQYYPAELSGGEKQRVAIARALVRNPTLLLCDEPTSSLDEENTEEIIRLLKRIHKEFSPTILFVSHELSSVKTLCERVLVLESGRITDEFFNTPKDVSSPVLSYAERIKRGLKDVRN